MKIKIMIAALITIAMHQFAFAQVVSCPSKLQLNQARFDEILRGSRIWANIYEYSVRNKTPIVDSLGYYWIISVELVTTSDDYAKKYAYQYVSSMRDEYKVADNYNGKFYCQYDSEGVYAWTV